MRATSSGYRILAMAGAVATLALLGGCATEPLAAPDPPQATVQPLPDTRVYVYPNAGQGAAQIDRDRYECHVWAVRQTGFDPSVAQVAPHQRVEVVPVPAPGSDMVAGAATGAIVGAAVSGHHDGGGNVLLGAVAGALLGAASDSARAQQAAAAERRINAGNDQQYFGLEQQAGDYRRAVSACLQGRSYTVK